MSPSVWRRGLAAVLVAAVPLTFAAAAGAGESAPAVQAMIVGRGGRIVASSRTVTAASSTVRVGSRSCAIAAGTPLAVLVAIGRAGGPGFALRDYGRCGAAPGSSAELFVDSLAGEANAGANGWEYKVDGLAGSTGAADPSGPEGDGRGIASGERVLWFWCHAAAGGCERTLEVDPASAAVTAGSSLLVTVEGYENEGHPRPSRGRSSRSARTSPPRAPAGRRGCSPRGPRPLRARRNAERARGVLSANRGGPVRVISAAPVLLILALAVAGCGIGPGSPRARSTCSSRAASGPIA